MKKTDIRYSTYLQILREELIPAMGCTEPIAIAYAAALARKTLQNPPTRVSVSVSGNIIKNVKSVVVPHTGGLRGISAAVAAGIVAGDAERELEVLSEVTANDISLISDFLNSVPIEIECADTPHIFDIMITVYSDSDSAYVRLAGRHTNVVSIEHNGKILHSKEITVETGSTSDRTLLSIENIIDFANSVNLEDIQELLERQINYNMAIAEEGLKNDYGANIGKVLLYKHEHVLSRKMRAYAAAGSDARMNGCEMPVIINSGSGNQGITTSVPVIVYARENNHTNEQLLRALCIANLVTIHLKTGIGCLSAYCGVVSAGCGAASGIAWLMGGGYDMIAHTIVNALAMDSGIICDGAKSSCAAKISSAIDAALLGLNMYLQGNQFYGGDGIIKKGVENTINTVSRLARDGMYHTDKEIIKLMMEN